MTKDDLNPLLLDGTELPRFDAIEVEHVEPGIRQLIANLSAMFDELESSSHPTWEGLVEPLERIHDRLGVTWGVVEHLMSVRNSEELRKAYEKVEPEIVELTMRIGQSQILYRRLVELRDGESFRTLDVAQKRIIIKLIQEAELAGVGLPDAQRERFKALKLEVAGLSTQFGNHLLDATKAFALDLTEPAEVDGLPRSFLEMAAQSARAAGQETATADEGPWRVTLDGPSYLGFMKYSTRRELREELYRAFVTRASSGPVDNGPLIDSILRTRREEAVVLGFDSYAELSLSTKMAATVERAEALLEELRAASYDAATGELEELRTFMRERGTLEADDLRHWDISYWSERLREERFDFSEEELRPYFPLPRVLDGLFGLAKRLFDIEVVSADGETPVWHEDVRFFSVRSLTGEELAAFYLDPYTRPAEKRGGAWMNEVLGRSALMSPDGRGIRLPVAHLICNGSPPVDGKPSLMTFREIETLFHEFGHALQHMLTTVDYGLASGIRNVEWDAVELPSQFMENWCYHRDTLVGLSAHHDTGEPLPDELFEKIAKARTFQAGLMMLRQLFYGFTDLELHHRFDPDSGDTPFDVQQRISEKTALLPPIPEDRFLCGFAHIFQGGYAAGYYSYKWAEVLSADAYAAFEEAGLDDGEALAETGRRFRENGSLAGGR